MDTYQIDVALTLRMTEANSAPALECPPPPLPDHFRQFGGA